MIANYEADRLQIMLDDKPDYEKRTLLRKAAFKWSPRFSAWQHQLTRNAVYAAKNLLSNGAKSAI